MKKIDGEKKIEWKKDITEDPFVVSEVDVSKRITSFSSLSLHYSNESILKKSGNSLIHIGGDRFESVIIDKAFLRVCIIYYLYDLLFVLSIICVSIIVCRVFIVCMLFRYCSIPVENICSIVLLSVF